MKNRLKKDALICYFAILPHFLHVRENLTSPTLHWGCKRKERDRMSNPESKQEHHQPSPCKTKRKNRAKPVFVSRQLRLKEKSKCVNEKQLYFYIIKKMRGKKPHSDHHFNQI